MEKRPRSSRQKSAKGGTRKIIDAELRDLARNPASLSNLAANYEALSRSAVGFSDASKDVARASSRQAWAPPVKQSLASSSSRFHTNSPLPQNPTLPAHPLPQAFGRAEDHIHLEGLVKLRERFNQADSSGDGGDTLDEEEFMAAFDKLFGLKGKNKEEMRTFFNKIDYNSDGFIDWDEFCTFMYLELHERDDAQARAKKVEFHFPAAAVQTPHKDSLCRVQHLTDGSLISCSMDGVICVWTHEMERKRVKKTEPGQTGKPKWVTDMAVCIHQSKILLTTGDHEIQFYELVNFAPYCQLKKLEDVPLKVDFWYSPEDHNDCIILVGDKGGCVTVIVSSNIQEAFRYWKLAPKGKDGMPTNSIDRLVSGTTGTKVYRWKLHSNWVSEVHYFPNLRCFASCSADSAASLVLGSPTGSTPVDSLLRSSQRRSTMNLFSAGKLNVSGGDVLPRSALQAKRRLSGDQRVFRVAKGVSTVDYCPKNNVIVTGSVDQMVRVWNPFITSKAVATLRGHEAPIFCVRLDSTSNRIYSIGNDNLIKVWHLVDHTCLHSVVPSKHKFMTTVEAFHYNPVKQQLVMGAEQMAVLCLATVGPKASVALSHNHPVTGVRFSRCFNQIVTACDGSVVRVWDITTGECVFEFSADIGGTGISVVDIDHSGRRLVTGGHNGMIKLWNYNNGYCIRTLDKGNSDEVTDIRFVSVNSNSYIMTVGWDRKVSLFADVSGSMQHVQNPIEAWSTSTEYAHTEDILSVAFGAPHLMATASFDGEIIVWSMISCNILSRLKARLPTFAGAVSPPTLQGEEAVQKVLFLDRRAKSKTSANLVASGPAGFIHFWNIYDSSAPVGYFPASRGSSVTTMAVDGTNSVLISGDMQGYVSLWNIKGYCSTVHAASTQPPKRIASWRAHTMKITCIELVEHWNVLVTASTDCTVRLWTLEGHYIGTFGQPSQWHLGNPSTYQYPFSPSDILTDPTSVPNIVRGEEPPKGTRERKGGRQKEEDRTPVRIPRGVQLDPMDVDSEEDIDEHLKAHINLDVPSRNQECSKNVGKRLRHFRVKSARPAISGVYTSLPCQPFTDEPQQLQLSPPPTAD